MWIFNCNIRLKYLDLVVFVPLTVYNVIVHLFFILAKAFPPDPDLISFSSIFLIVSITVERWQVGFLLKIKIQR